MKTLLLSDFSTNKPADSKTRTKFGGQPDWISAPEWPLSKETGKPMRFIGQIDLWESVYDQRGLNKVAYIFMTENEDDFVEGTYLMNGGENAIILQPNDHSNANNLSTGPTHSEESFYPITKLFESPYSEHDSDSFINQGFLGGEPIFIQSEEFPEDIDNWFFLGQLSELPFDVNFGDQGIGYAFIKKDGSKGAFLWQCF